MILILGYKVPTMAKKNFDFLIDILVFFLYYVSFLSKFYLLFHKACTKMSTVICDFMQLL